MSNEGHFDLSGVFHVQQNYLTDLSNSYPNVNNAPLVATYIHDLQNKAIESANDYNDANISASAILDQQTAMMNILHAEQQRLDEKKASIDNAIGEEERKALLTNSQRLRAAEYTKMIIVIIVGLCIHAILQLFSNTYMNEETPKGLNVLFIFAYITNIIVCGVIITKIYLTIQSRSQINFNELNLPPPKIVHRSDTTTTTTDYDDIFDSLGMCVGDECCGSNTTWDSSNGTCVPKNKPKSVVIEPTTKPIPSYSEAKPTITPVISTPSPVISTPAPMNFGDPYTNSVKKSQHELTKALSGMKKPSSFENDANKNAKKMMKQIDVNNPKSTPGKSDKMNTPKPAPTKSDKMNTPKPAPIKSDKMNTTKPAPIKSDKMNTTKPAHTEGFTSISVNRVSYLPNTNSKLLPHDTTNVCTCDDSTNNCGFLPANSNKNDYVSYK